MSDTRPGNFNPPESPRPFFLLFDGQQQLLEEKLDRLLAEGEFKGGEGQLTTTARRTPRMSENNYVESWTLCSPDVEILISENSLV